MNQADETPRVSVTAGVIAVAMLFAVLLMHLLGPSVVPQQHAGESTAARTGQMTMDDGSTMNMGDMGAPEEPLATTESAPDHGATEATDEDGAHHGMGGVVNWQAIGLILALVAAGVSLAAGLKDYLERQIALGTLLDAGVLGE